MRRTHWKPWEEAILRRELYSNPAWWVRERFLPHRTVNAIYQHAHGMGLKIKNAGTVPAKMTYTEECPDHIEARIAYARRLRRSLAERGVRDEDASEVFLMEYEI